MMPSSPAVVPILVGEPESVIEAIEVHLPNGLQVQVPVGMAAARWLPTVQALMTC